MLNTTYLRFFVLNAALVATTATTATIVNAQQQEAPPAQKAFLPPVTNATTTAEVTVTAAPTRSPTRGPQNDNPTTSPVDKSHSDDPITPTDTPTEHTTAPAECDPSPECVPYWVNGIYYHNCCPPPPPPPMCTPRESSNSPQTGDRDDRRKNIERHADHCQAFLVFESPFLSVSSGRSDPYDDLIVPDRVVLWLGPPQFMRDTKGNIDTIVSRVMEYILTPNKSEAGHNRKGRRDLRNTNADAAAAVSYTLTVRPAGYAATWNEVLRLYQASIAPNNGFSGPPDTWLEAGSSTASIVALETANSPRQQFVSAIKARWVFDPSTDPDLQELFEIALGGGQQQETTATPASFDDLYHNLVVNHRNQLPPPPPPPRRYQDRFDVSIIMYKISMRMSTIMYKPLSMEVEEGKHRRWVVVLQHRRRRLNWMTHQ